MQLRYKESGTPPPPPTTTNKHTDKQRRVFAYGFALYVSYTRTDEQTGIGY